VTLHIIKYISPLTAVAAALLTIGCSSQKNTARSRWWHAFNARYNTYYNGSVAYIDGSLDKENGNKDNFTEMLPLYTVGNKASRELGKSNFDKAIEKCQKAIKLHSIKRRPVWDKQRRKTEKDIEWLNRKEYNPFLWKAWILMGRAQFHQGKFDEAASTFSYMSRLYKTQPAIYGKARAWLAKSYIEEGWLYDAEDVIRNMQRDSIHWQARKEWDYTYADYYIHAGDYQKAIPYLRKVIKHEMRRKQRAREWFLMGQLQAAVGNKAEATRAFKRVIRQNPPYEVEFNARIALTEVMSASNGKKMISRLKRMAASDKNKDYLDQVYYAIGNIYLNLKDTANAISAYEKGNSGSTRSGIEKGVLLLRLGGLYWEKERYNDAQRCYGEAIGLLDKERKDYEELSQRSKVLDELVPYTDAVHLQDSLQTLAKMSEKDRNAAIDKVIEALKKKEKEERNRQAELDAQTTIAQNSGNNNNVQGTRPQARPTGQKNTQWYFYNQMTVNQGKTEFQKQWGKRENVDNWQRINQTVVASAQDNRLSEAQLDSITHAEAEADSLAQVADSAQNNPHKREYYLAQIPFTEDQVAASNAIIMDGLHNSGVIFKDKLDNLVLSEKALRRITDSYPDYENMADVYYHLFLLYSRKGMPEVAESYIEKLKRDYPDNEWTTLLTDPYFAENAKIGEHIEDSIYAATYDAFKADRYREIETNIRISQTRFPLGANRDKFIFIGGLGKLNSGDADGCLTDMKTLVEKYPQSELSPMAGMIVNGVNAGRKLHGGKFDIGNVWERRSEVLNTTDSTAQKALTAERNTDFVFMIAYRPDSVNENQMLYELAKYNFTSYMVRNFDISIEDADGLHRMTVAGFRNYDEALQYARQLHSKQTIIRNSANCRTIIISSQNAQLLGTQYSYDDYDDFYNKHFAPLKVSTEQLLAEPEEITTTREDNSGPAEDDTRPQPDNATIIDNVLDTETVDNGTTVITDSPEMQEGNDGQPDSNDDVLIPADPTPDNITDEDGGTTIADEPDTESAGEKQGIEIKDEPMEETTPEKTAPEKAAPDKQKPDNDKKNNGETTDDSNGVILPTDNNDGTKKAPAKKEEQPLPADNGNKKPDDKKQPEDDEADKEEKKNTPSKVIEDEFYFDDDLSTPEKKKDNKLKDVEELDDEYYDLEGF